MIRNTTINDLESLDTIKNKVKLDPARLDDCEYQYTIQKTGFLLGSDEIYDAKALLNKAEEFLVLEEGNKIKGFISCDHEDKYLDDEYKTWFSEDAKSIYYSDPKATSIYAVAVDLECAQSGVASSLLGALEQRLMQKGFRYLFSIVTMSPVTNCPSLLFHSRNNFKRVAMGRPRELFGLKNFASVLLMKELAK
ncbi:MAG: GNAT family N-acetyltransferase [bacterium]|nr:GNAT family N-acetyltransferase [bacterium]